MNNYVDLLAPKQGYTADYEPLTWAKHNCPGYITNNVVQKNGDYYYRFYFNDDKDRLLFYLKWL